MKSLVKILIVVWFGLIVLLGACGRFVQPAGLPPIPILIGVLTPLAVFAAAYLRSEAFRKIVLSADVRLLAAIEAWRAGGLGFLALYAHGILPGLFGFP